MKNILFTSLLLLLAACNSKEEISPSEVCNIDMMTPFIFECNSTISSSKDDEERRESWRQCEKTAADLYCVVPCNMFRGSLTCYGEADATLRFESRFSAQFRVE